MIGTEKGGRSTRPSPSNVERASIQEFSRSFDGRASNRRYVADGVFFGKDNSIPTSNPGRKALNPSGLGTKSPSMRKSSSLVANEKVIGPRRRLLVGRIFRDPVWPDWGDP
jgi:hypothetical protein